METIYTCSNGVCGAKGMADRMWNLERSRTNGKLVVVCGRDAHEARKRDIRAFRLSETLLRDAETERRRIETGAFFAAFQKAAKKSGPANRPPHSSPLPSSAS